MTYSPAASWLHWTMAIGFACMWALGCTMATSVEEDSPLEEWLYDLHVSLGVTLLALLALRVFVRWWQVPPPLPSELSRFERRAAHARHIALYLFPAAIIARGWLETDPSGHTVHWFGVELAKPLPTLKGRFAEQLAEAAELLHKWLAYAMLAVAIGHALAAVKHRIGGHDAIHRMRLGE